MSGGRRVIEGMGEQGTGVDPDRFPVEGDPAEPRATEHAELTRIGFQLGDWEHVKRRATWNANSIGRDNWVHLRRCSSEHLRAIAEKLGKPATLPEGME